MSLDKSKLKKRKKREIALRSLAARFWRWVIAKMNGQKFLL